MAARVDKPDLYLIETESKKIWLNPFLVTHIMEFDGGNVAIYFTSGERVIVPADQVTFLTHKDVSQFIVG